MEFCQKKRVGVINKQHATTRFRPTSSLYTQAPVVQTLDSTIHRINHYPADKYYWNQLRYPLDSNLSSGQRYQTFENKSGSL